MPNPSDERQRMAPVQGYAAGIPWDMHLRAYDAYCKEYRPQKALIEGDCRGGFGDKELDMFIPGWREELSVRAKLVAENAELRRVLGEAVRVMQYAASSFAQVPSDQTVPPIVLHDCKDKLDECWRAALGYTKEGT